MSNFIDFESRLTAQIKSGNTAAFKEVYSRHWKGIFAIAYSFLKSKQEAEDTVQDIFIRFWTKREHLNDQLDYKPYLFSIARNALVDIVKSTAKRRILDIEAIHDLGFNTTEYEIEYKDLSQLANEAIDMLPSKRRIIFELKRKEGLNADEIAVEMGISKTMVHRQLNLAHSFIRTYLETHASGLAFLLLALSLY